MTPARRTLPARAAMLLRLRRPAVASQVPQRGLAVPAAPAAQPARAAAAAALPSRFERRFSAPAEGPGAVPGSRIWTFDEVKRQLEAAGRRPDGPRDRVVIVDVRERHELRATGKIPGAVNIPVTTAARGFRAPDDEFEHDYGFERPPREATLLFYCRAGVRARTAAALARQEGWETVGEYTGSWLDWEKRGGPVEKVGHDEH